ncbi:ABC transporter ATP-binding protein [Nocardia sp. alder85J]|uniref:ABC transporter ATP-binding protein n=1 Tax=Nocardia sp. alder85J TaxID=2862949 RepID=UPI001CD2C75A|nr:ABC transporter ATP-binding protein [Nocardia sp. alder85J]MCX4094164.1 ABC transporter ATP-binding protein [Nocardia sp. alder85J]
MTEKTEALRLTRLSKRYGEVNPVAALRGISLTLASGSFTAIMGPSGSGKSTLLQCAAGLDVPSEGQVHIAGLELPRGDEQAITEFRRKHIGFVFQQYNLIPYLTVTQNVALPSLFAGRAQDRRACADLLARLGLTSTADRLPSELSGGQQQRVAIARALLTRPAVLFADEPTGALDTASGRRVLSMLRESADAFGQTIVMVTHDPVAAAYADTVVFLADGVMVGTMPRTSAAAIAQRMTDLDDIAARTGVSA